MSVTAYEIPSIIPFAKPNILEFRNDGILYKGAFIHETEYQKISYYSERKSSGSFIVSDSYTYYVDIEGGNKKIWFLLSENAKKTIMKERFSNIVNTLLRTAGTKIIRNIIAAINSGVDLKIGNATFSKTGIYCKNSFVIASAVIFPEISIRGKSIFVPYGRATCSYDSGIIKVSDSLHTKLNCRIDPQIVGNAVLIPHIIKIMNQN